MKRFWIVWCLVCAAGCAKIMLTIRPTVHPAPSPTTKIAIKPTPSPTGVVLGTTVEATPVPPTPKPSPTLYGTNTPNITVTNYSGEIKKVPITLINKSSQPVLWYIKLPSTQSATYPIAINDANETTGTIAANSYSTVYLNTRSSASPVFKETAFIVFRNNLQILETVPLYITINSESTKYISAYSDKDSSETIQFIPKGSYGMLVANKHSEEITWSAEVVKGTESIELGFTSGTTAKYVSTYVPVVFKQDKRGTLTYAEINITYRNSQQQELGKHAIHLTITD